MFEGIVEIWKQSLTSRSSKQLLYPIAVVALELSSNMKKDGASCMKCLISDYDITC